MKIMLVEIFVFISKYRVKQMKCICEELHFYFIEEEEMGQEKSGLDGKEIFFEICIGASSIHPPVLPPDKYLQTSFIQNIFYLQF